MRGMRQMFQKEEDEGKDLQKEAKNAYLTLPVVGRRVSLLGAEVGSRKPGLLALSFPSSSAVSCGD